MGFVVLQPVSYSGWIYQRQFLESNRKGEDETPAGMAIDYWVEPWRLGRKEQEIHKFLGPWWWPLRVPLTLVPSSRFRNKKSFFFSAIFSSPPLSHTTSPTDWHGGHIHVADLPSSIWSSYNYLGLLHLQAAQCMTKLQHSESLSPTYLPRTRPSTTFTGFLFTFFVVLALSTSTSLQRPRPLRETAGKQIFTYSSSLSIVFSDSSGRLSAMRKKKEPKRLRISIRQRMAVMVMLLCFPPKGFSLNLKEKRWKVWFKSTRLTWRCGATPPAVSCICKILNLVAGGHLGHLWMPSLFKIVQLQYIWQR